MIAMNNMLPRTAFSCVYLYEDMFVEAPDETYSYMYVRWDLHGHMIPNNLAELTMVTEWKFKAD